MILKIFSNFIQFKIYITYLKKISKIKNNLLTPNDYDNSIEQKSNYFYNLKLIIDSAITFFNVK